MNKEQKKRLWIVGGIVAAVVLIVIAVMNVNSGGRKRDALLELGDKYLNEMDYEAAIATYDEVIAIDPKCEAAYIGKATAQYNLGLYEDAIETLQVGIKQIEESAALTELLQQIQDEYVRIMGENAEENPEVQTDTVVAEENDAPFMLLNYSSITRHSDTQEKQFQLEVIADEDAKESEIIWTSDSPEIATVSADGLVTLTGEEGYGTIVAECGDRYATCSICVQDGDYYQESDTVSVYLPGLNVEKKGKEDYFYFELSKEETGEVSLTNRYGYGNYVYYSGDVAIPETLQFQGKDLRITKILPAALYWCNTMETVTIPASVKSFDNSESSDIYCYNPFYFCTNLKEIIVEEDNEYFKVIDGVLYSSDGKKLLSYPAAKAGRSYTIPKEVEVVYKGAFLGCRNLEEILVEEGNQRYESIDGVLIDKEDKFFSARTLIAYPCGKTQKEYKIPDNIEVVGEYAFSCPALEKVICGSNVAELYGSFWNCEQLKSIEGMDQIKYINDSLFKECNQVEKISGGIGTISIYLSNNGAVRELEIEGLSEMQNLQTLSLYGIKLNNVEDICELTALQDLEIRGVESDIDVGTLQNLKGLTRLELSGIKNAEGFSWLEGMNEMENLTLEIEELEISDLGVLAQLENLKSVHIDVTSAENLDAELEEELRQQIEFLKEDNPDCFFWIAGIS